MREIVEKGLRWIDVEHPSKLDIETLAKEFPFFHPLTLGDTLSPIQRAKVDVFDEHLFIVLHFPVYDKKAGRINTTELDIFVGKDFVVTLHDGRIKPLVELFDEALNNPKVRKEVISKGGAGFLLYNILNIIVDSIFPTLYKIDVELDIIEDKIFEGGEISKQIEALSDQRRNVLIFRRIISPQRIVIPHIRSRLRLVGIKEEMTFYFDDLTDHIEKIWQTLEEQKEIVEGLQDSTQAVVDHITNQVVRVLTVMTVVFAPLTLIASVYGMNVSLPFERNPQTIFGIVFGMFVLSGVMIFAFRKLHWL